MKILDRYIGRLFLFNFIILLVVVMGLIVLIDLIINFDEFVQLTQKNEGSSLDRLWRTVGVLVDFYGPMMLLFYTYLAGLVPVGAAGFTLAQLLRSRELTAMLAGGGSMHRIAMPILVLGFAANAVLVINQEVLLPPLASKLARSQSDLKRGGALVRVQFMPDGQGSLYTASEYHPETQTMHNVTVLRRQAIADQQWGRTTERITADTAVWDEKRQGWVLTKGVIHFVDQQAGDNPDYGAPRFKDIDFLPGALDPVTIMLREKARYRTLLSIGQLTELMAKPALLDTAQLRVILHSRFSLVVLNMLILLMALPYFLQRVPGNLLVPVLKAAALAIGAWAGGFIMLQIPVGSLPPVAVAWLPVAIYLPVAYWMMTGIET